MQASSARTRTDNGFGSGSIERNTGEEFVLVSSGIFECPIEHDGSVLLSTLQSQIPNATGLHYSVEGSIYRRAIKFDKRTWKFSPPSDGWRQRVYTVASYADTTSSPGCMMRNPVSYDRYDRATRTFQNSVEAVERLFDISYDTEQTPNKAIEKLMQDNGRLRSKNKELENQKQVLETELVEAQQKLQRLLERLDSQSVWEETQIRNEPIGQVKESDLDEGHVSVRDRIAHLEEQFQGSLTDTTETRKSLEEKQSQVDELQQRLENVTSAHQVSNDELARAKNRCVELEQELVQQQRLNNHTSQRVTELESHLSNKDQVLTNVLEQLEIKEESLTKTVKELEEMKARCFILEESSKDNEWTGVRKENEDLHYHVSELEDKIKMLEIKDKDMNDENRELKGQMLQLEEKSISFQHSQMTNGLLHDETFQTLTNVASLKTIPEFADPDDDPKQLRDQLQEANKRWYDTQSDLERLHENEAQLQESLLSTRRELDDTKWRCGELESMLLGGAIGTFSVDNAKKQISDLLKEVDRLRRLNDESIWKFGKLEAEMGVECQQLKNLTNRCQVMEKELEDKSGKLQAAEFKIKELENELSVIQSQYARLEEENKYKHSIEKSVDNDGSQLKVNQELMQIVSELNGCKERNQWLEDQLAHYKHLYEDTNNRLNQLQNVLDIAHRHLWDAFVIRREPYIDRHKWQLSMWHEGSQEQYARIWYEFDAPEANHVFLSSSHYNWECLLSMMWHEHEKWGVWVDVPRGRHEFKFLVDGEWKTSDQYPTCSNGIDGLNNYRQVE